MNSQAGEILLGWVRALGRPIRCGVTPSKPQDTVADKIFESMRLVILAQNLAQNHFAPRFLRENHGANKTNPIPQNNN
jgi:hypothetical protein